jgi:hypothetical protein
MGFGRRTLTQNALQIRYSELVRKERGLFRGAIADFV